MTIKQMFLGYYYAINGRDIRVNDDTFGEAN